MLIAGEDSNPLNAHLLTGVASTINRTASDIALACGFQTPRNFNFMDVDSPRIRHFRNLAEVAYEAITGDRPDYADDEN